MIGVVATEENVRPILWEEEVNLTADQLAEKDLQKVVFIRYAPGKEAVCDNNGVCEPRENWKNCPSDCPKGGRQSLPGRG